MKKTFTRFGAWLLALVILLSLVACGAPEYSFEEYGSGDLNAMQPSVTLRQPGESNTFPTMPTKNTETNTTTAPAATTPGSNPVSEMTDPSLRYVMIYNPKVYDEYASYDRSSMAVGTLGSQVDPSAHRADGLEEELKYSFVSQGDLLKNFPIGSVLEGDRGEVMGNDYTLGQTRNFLVGGNLNNRKQQQMTCAYVGQYCYLWIPSGRTDLTSAVKEAGREFDNNIYNKLVNTFGKPRFVGTTGKINLVFEDMGNSLLGHFVFCELLTDAELNYLGIDNSLYNTGDAVVHINYNWLNTGNAANDEVVYSTMAHEFQHLLNFSAAVETANLTLMNTWLNEGFSGYIEAEIYAKAKETSGQIGSFNGSDLIRNGQSLYNFKTNYNDIGVYGSVYYFAKYLEKIAGKSVFRDVMDYWRDSYSSTLSTAEALAKSVPSSVYNGINNSLNYSGLGLSFNSKEEEWMSKLTLNFYMAMLANDEGISAFNKIDRETLLYDRIDGVNIEGGGRIIVALNGNSFEIPDDADSGLIYVGLDKNFKPIPGFIYG